MHPDGLEISVSNCVLNSATKAESNGVGLKTCKKLCEALGAKFEISKYFSDGDEMFSAKILLPLKSHTDKGIVNES